MAARVHVIGAGLAGLAAAVRLTADGVSVIVHEAAGHAGGRCRSFRDEALGADIDNGNHLVLSGNHAALDYLDLIGARDSLSGPAVDEFPFLALETGSRWSVKPDAGAIPWSVLRGGGRVPGTSLGEYLGGWRIIGAGPEKTVGQCLDTDGPLWRRFWAPLIVSIMNTEPAQSSAALMWRVLKETFGEGAAACRPLIAVEGLSPSFVDPAVQYLEALGGDIRFGRRLRSMTFADDRVAALEFTDGAVALGAEDHVISAVPAPVAAGLIPAISAPDRFSAIVNGHFRLSGAPPDQPFLGILGGTAEWLFVRGDIVSVTVSAADALAERSSADIAEAMWDDIVRAFDRPGTPLGAHRIVKEKRATFVQTPDQVKRRPPCRTRWRNLYLAGDWTDTGLPATIEGTIRSGFRAAASLKTA